MSDPLFTVITPTIGRPSLLRTKASVPKAWEHIVVEDHTGDYGNTPKAKGFDLASGEYVMYLDDDDFYLPAIESVLEAVVRNERPTWGVFPIMRFGQLFYHLPPGLGHTTSNQFFYRRDTGLRFPTEDLINGDIYTADGTLIERLKALYPYVAVRSRPLAVVEHQRGR